VVYVCVVNFHEVDGRAVGDRIADVHAVDVHVVDENEVDGRVVDGRVVDGFALDGRVVNACVVDGREVNGRGVDCRVESARVDFVVSGVGSFWPSVKTHSWVFRIGPFGRLEILSRGYLGLGWLSQGAGRPESRRLS
jgi:hypothetical protein